MTTAHYASKKKGFTLHRPVTFRPVMFNGEVVHEKVIHQPIEFKNGRLATDDPEVIAYLDSHIAFKRGDYIKLDDIATQVEGAKIAAIGSPPSHVTKIEGVRNRNQAVQALVERGVDPETFDRTTTKDAIIEIARLEGFEFTGW